MRFTIHEMPLSLTGQASLRLEEANGTVLRVLRGRVWVTQEGCIDDLFLDSGGEYRFRNDGRVLISVEGGRAASATVAFEGKLAVQTESSFFTRLLQLPLFRSKHLPGPSGAAGVCP